MSPDSLDLTWELIIGHYNLYFFFWEDVLEGAFRHINVKQKLKVFKTLHAKVQFGLALLRENKTRTEYENMTIPFQEKNPGCI